ncbi:DUF2247 family protein [Actinopolyspora halophila]|uniref:DUF2247 family protein n=1 Tax=Actinopolyspora halophila TaxID=1850 RepID=UPI0012FB23D0|nr:DUF2247 family protein [Actinopolyspora halophila]
MKEFQVLRSLGLASWAALRYGLEENWVSFEDVSTYAADVLAEEREDADDRAVRLAVYDFEGKEESLDLCSQLEKMKNENECPGKILKKWILAKLIAIDRNWGDPEEKASELDVNYAMLGYQEEMLLDHQERVNFHSSCNTYGTGHYNEVILSVDMASPLDEARRLINELSEELSVRRDC